MINIHFWIYVDFLLFLLSLFFHNCAKKYKHFVKQGKRAFTGNAPLTERNLDGLDEVQTIAYFFLI